MSEKLFRKRGGASMLCPKCQSPSRVIQTRRHGEDEHLEIVRDRECLKKSHRFKTTESVDAD
jgi:transcriptional regulator NrdR family protein